MGVEQFGIIGDRSRAHELVDPLAVTPLGARVRRDAHRECEKLGVIEALLAAERYESILEIGCGQGDLARRLLGRCTRYCGMEADVAALARVRAALGEGRCVPLSTPFRMPAGAHELVVLLEVLHLFDTVDRRLLERALEVHAACREIVVVSPRDENVEHDSDGRGPELERFAEALAGRFEAVELAVRRRYRVDALIAR